MRDGVFQLGLRTLLGVLLAAAVAARAAPPIHWPPDLLAPSRPWTAANATVRSAGPRSAARAITSTLEGPARVGTPVPGGLAGAGRLVVQGELAPPATGIVRLAVYLKDADGLWYECARAEPLVLGKRAELIVDLTRSGALEPRGHFGEWDGNALSDVREVGVGLLAERGALCTFRLDVVRVEAGGAPTEPLRLFDVVPPPQRVERYAMVETSFRLNRAFENPFDPAQVAVTAEVQTEAGAAERVPGFFSQAFVPRKGAPRELVPFGAPRWTVRYTPTQTGPHELRLVAETPAGTLRSPALHFVVAPSARRGFLRVAKSDPRVFEDARGDVFRPVGHNLHAPVDRRGAWVAGIRRPEDRGLAAYAERFARLARTGQNVTEVWMAAWWAGLEWSSDRPGYRGAGRYNLRHAARLDRLFALAEEHGLRLHLVVDNHGKASDDVDAEWRHHPYHRRHGGFLRRPQELFTDPRARTLYKRKLRYLLARWGQSPHLLGLTLWNEVDLAGGNTPAARREKAEWCGWAVSTVKHLTPHVLVGVHFSTNYQSVDPGLAELPGVDFVACDAYHESEDLVELLDETAAVLGRFGKPILVTEFGGNWYGGSVPRLRADLHAGLWSSAFLPLAGTPLFWWFDVLEKHGLDGEFAALRRFLDSAGGRPGGLEARQVMVRGDEARLLDVGSLALVGPGAARVYLYDKKAAALWVDAEHLTPLPSLEVEIPGIEPGSCQVVFWDTATGRAMREEAVRAAGGSLRLRTPPFRRDLAITVSSRPEPLAAEGKDGAP